MKIVWAKAPSLGIVVVIALVAMWQQISMAPEVISKISPFFLGHLKDTLVPEPHPSSHPLLTNHGVQSNVRRRQDALTQNIYYKMIKRWATWWWCKWWHGRKFNFVLPGKLIFFQNSALVFTLCSCDSSYTITESTCSSLFIFKASTFYFPHLKPSVSKAFQC